MRISLSRLPGIQLQLFCRPHQIPHFWQKLRREIQQKMLRLLAQLLRQYSESPTSQRRHKGGGR
jgi:hypothetical protein